MLDFQVGCAMRYMLQNCSRINHDSCLERWHFSKAPSKLHRPKIAARSCALSTEHSWQAAAVPSRR